MLCVFLFGTNVRSYFVLKGRLPNRSSMGRLFSRSSAKLSHSLKVSEHRRNTPKSAQNRSESLCAGRWVQCRIFWAWFGFALGPHPARNRRFPTGSLQVVGALLAQPRKLLAPIQQHFHNLMYLSSQLGFVCEALSSSVLLQSGLKPAF